MEGDHEDKIFCPGYGEYYSAAGGDIEAIALALPADALSTTKPSELEALAKAAEDLWSAGATNDFAKASAAQQTISSSWSKLSASAPKNITKDVDAAVALAETGVNASDASKTKQAAVDVARWALDLRLRYEPLAGIDRGRFELWARQVTIDADTQQAAGLSSDVIALEWVRDRIAPQFDAASLEQIDARLKELRKAADGTDFTGAKQSAEALRQLLAAH
jgi:hypothetical protein